MPVGQKVGPRNEKFPSLMRGIEFWDLWIQIGTDRFVENCNISGGGGPEKNLEKHILSTEEEFGFERGHDSQYCEKEWLIPFYPQPSIMGREWGRHISGMLIPIGDEARRQKRRGLSMSVRDDEEE